MALISRLRVITLASNKMRLRNQCPKIDFFPNVKQVSYQKINQAVFDNRFIKIISQDTRG